MDFSHTHKEGRTDRREGSRPAHGEVWYVFGVPTVISSDQGPQFVAQWWRTLCGRMGIRQALSQARRPQGNGRAEVAGKSIKVILAKMHATQHINWVEALPRVVVVHNTTPRSDHKYSPFQILFGRPWSDASQPYPSGLPY